VTDESGYFNFSSKDSVVDVQVDLAGYENRNFRLQNDIASNKLVIEPRKESLQEVDVVGYGTQKKESTTSARTKTPDPLTSKKNRTKETVNVQGAVPVIGWIEYEKYLDKNKIPPLSNPLLKGEVVVSFQVKRQGTLSDFKIEKGLSKDYDAEALRLVREGPKWKILDGRRTRITVIVNF
jgi:TonB family protein